MSTKRNNKKRGIPVEGHPFFTNDSDSDNDSKKRRKVMNPLTGKYILFNGKRHKELIRDGIIASDGGPTKSTPIMLKELSGPVSFYYYENILKKSNVLFLGDQHIRIAQNDCIPCSKPNCYELSDYLLRLAESDNELSLFIEDNYLRNNMDIKKSKRGREKQEIDTENDQGPLSKVGGVFAVCFNKRNKKLCKKRFPNFRYNMVDLRSSFTYNNGELTFDKSYQNLFTKYVHDFEGSLIDNFDVIDYLEKNFKGIENILAVNNDWSSDKLFWNDTIPDWQRYWGISNSDRLKIHVDIVKKYSNKSMTVSKYKKIIKKNAYYMDELFELIMKDQKIDDMVTYVYREIILKNILKKLILDILKKDTLNFSNYLKVLKKVILNVPFKIQDDTVTIEYFMNMYYSYDNYSKVFEDGFKKSYSKTRKQFINMPIKLANSLLKSYLDTILDLYSEIDETEISTRPDLYISKIISNVFIDLYTIGRMFRSYKKKDEYKNIILLAGDLHVDVVKQTLKRIGIEPKISIKTGLKENNYFDKCIRLSKLFNFFK